MPNNYWKHRIHCVGGEFVAEYTIEASRDIVERDLNSERSHLRGYPWFSGLDPGVHEGVLCCLIARHYFLCRSFRRRDTSEIAVIPLEIGRAGEVAFEKVSAPRNLDEGEIFGNGVRGWESEISAHYGQ